jgi:hypothetical protein
MLSTKHFQELNDVAAELGKSGNWDTSVKLHQMLLLHSADCGDNNLILGIKKQLIISCWYSKNSEYREYAKQLCDEVGFDYDLPWEDRYYARINSTWYAKSSKELYSKSFVKGITWRPDNGYNCMNPSICNYNGHIYLVIRTVNYDIHYTDNNHYYQMKDNDQWIVRTRNYLAELNTTLDIINIREIILPATLPPVAFAQVIGFEDMRLFEHQGELWTSSTVRQLVEDGHHHIVLAKMELLPDRAQLTEWKKIVPQHVPASHEKNWMAISRGDSLNFVYKSEPQTLIDTDGNCVKETKNVWAFDAFRGGSPLIPFDNGYLSIIHETSVYSYMPRRYVHRFVYYNTDLNIEKISEIFYFVEQGIEFAAGMCYNTDHSRLLVSFGFKDKEAMIASFDVLEVFRSLTPVPPVITEL